MNRRDLIKYLLTTPIALTLDVEKMLWVPGEKKIFLVNNPYNHMWVYKPSLEQIKFFEKELKGLVLYGMAWKSYVRERKS